MTQIKIFIEYFVAILGLEESTNNCKMIQITAAKNNHKNKNNRRTNMIVYFTTQFLKLTSSVLQIHIRLLMNYIYDNILKVFYSNPTSKESWQMSWYLCHLKNLTCISLHKWKRIHFHNVCRIHLHTDWTRQHFYLRNILWYENII